MINHNPADHTNPYPNPKNTQYVGLYTIIDHRLMLIV